MTATKIQINGVVQGVGFRPFIYRLARKHGLAGWVLNSSRGVEIHVQGRSKDVDSFVSDIRNDLPPQALIDDLASWPAEPGDYGEFTIRESLEGEGATRISPDIALCHDCLDEMRDEGDRRRGYPFINCTNCGPRFSIINDTPYDRPLTTMAGFTMCPACRKEYDDPADRRFHAQPNACPVCGPRVWLADRTGAEMAEMSEALAKTAELLLAGDIVAVKGIGGFHLACDAGNEAAVGKLRSRKNRPDKPLALMCGSLEEVRGICEASPHEAKVLGSGQAPIVLLRKSEIRDQNKNNLSTQVAPGNNYLGVMLPYAPVHHLLFRELKQRNPGFKALVMTSGNIQDQPVVTDNQAALSKLAGIADHFLLNDREIGNRNDDSIVFVAGPADQKDQGTWSNHSQPTVQIVRHSRGYAPNPINLPLPVPPTLAVGGEMKNVFCLAAGKKAYLSQHIGEMDSTAALDFFEEMAEKYQHWFKIKPEVIVHDLHPNYLTTRWAREQKGVSLRAVQHHQAHILSALADHGTIGPAIGVSFDGTGYGQDGKIWGGEFFLFDGKTMERAGHLEYLPLPGGEASIKKPYRIAAAYGQHLSGRLPEDVFPEARREELEVVAKQVDSGFNLAWTSSLGRLFDAASGLLGICPSITFEAQAAIALENCQASGVSGGYGFDLAEQNGMCQIYIKKMWQQLTADTGNGTDAGICSARFHNTIVDFTLAMCDNLKLKSGIKTVALSGGVFQNRHLLEGIRRGLMQKDFQVIIHRQVPSNDGGLALGQVVSSSLGKQ